MESKRSHKSLSCDYQIEYEEWCESEPESSEVTSQVLHRVLLLASDGRVSHSRVARILHARPDDHDALTQSTEDDVTLPVCDAVLPLDLYVVRRVRQLTQHTYQLWIQNGLSGFRRSIFQGNVLQLQHSPPDAYYKSFEAVIYCAERRSEYTEAIETLLTHCPCIKVFRIVEGEPYCSTPSKKVKLSEERSVGREWVCGSIDEVIAQVVT